MRWVIAVAAVAAMILASGGAQAGKRVFIFASGADSYGVDQCLVTGAPCGQAVANWYCRSRQFHRALSFRDVGRDDITGAIPADPGACRGSSCGNFVAIECSR